VTGRPRSPSTTGFFLELAQPAHLGNLNPPYLLRQV
jgi:hypothetical protein